MIVKLVSSKFIKSIDAVKPLKDVFDERKKEKYKSLYEGVDTIDFILHPQYSLFTLDIVFKLLHSNEDIPMIKYNPGRSQEKLSDYIVKKLL